MGHRHTSPNSDRKAMKGAVLPWSFNTYIIMMHNLFYYIIKGISLAILPFNKIIQQTCNKHVNEPFGLAILLRHNIHYYPQHDNCACYGTILPLATDNEKIDYFLLRNCQHRYKYLHEKCM